MHHIVALKTQTTLQPHICRTLTWPIGMDPDLSCVRNSADFEMYAVQHLLVLRHGSKKT